MQFGLYMYLKAAIMDSYYNKKAVVGDIPSLHGVTEFFDGSRLW